MFFILFFYVQTQIYLVVLPKGAEKYFEGSSEKMSDKHSNIKIIVLMLFS